MYSVLNINTSSETAQRKESGVDAAAKNLEAGMYDVTFFLFHYRLTKSTFKEVSKNMRTTLERC